MNASSAAQVSDTPEKTNEHARHWMKVYFKEFDKESDRAAVIVTAAIFDDSLSNLLRQYLVPNPSSTDDLFDGVNAPLATFSAKISMAHRLGLISSAFARNLVLIKRIRNEFAHKIHNCTFEDSSIKARVFELYKSQKFKNEEKDRDLYPMGARGNFLVVCTWMLWSLNTVVEETKPLHEGAAEFGFVEFS
jgi:DNA-binding MltR family transcriptional regulator